MSSPKKKQYAPIRRMQRFSAVILAVILFSIVLGAFQLITVIRDAKQTLARDTTNQSRTCEISSEGHTDKKPVPSLYQSPAGQKQLETYLNDPSVATAVNSIESLQPIAAIDNAAIRSDIAIEAGRTFAQSAKVTEHGDPLGWEVDLGTATSASTHDYAVRLEYSASLPVSLGISYRTTPESAPRSIELGTLPAVTAWQTQTLRISSTAQSNERESLTISAAGIGSVRIASLKIVPLKDGSLQEGIITVAFDDGWESIYETGLPLFTKYQIPTTQFIVSDFSLGKQQVDGYMGRKQVQKLASLGHEIQSHSFQHCDATQLETTVLQQSITTSADQFKKSLNISPTTYAHPFGAFDASVNEALIPSFQYIRSSSVGYNNRYFDRYNILVQPVTDHTTTQEIESWVSQAKESKQWLVLVYHRVDETGEYSTPSAALEQHLQIIRASGLPVVTMKDAISRIDSQR